MRSMSRGRLREYCRGMTRDEMMDIPGGIKLAQDAFFKASGMHLKIFAIDCKASYIQFSALIIILFFLKI